MSPPSGSAPGTGTTPHRHEPPVALTWGTKTMSNAATVLVVEDNKRTAEMLDLLFRAEGYEPELLTDGHAAIQRLSSPPPSLVILDVMMPQTNGLDVLRAIREQDAWSQTPVIMTSARGADEEIWEGWRAGADYYLVKPYKLDELWRIAEALLQTGQVSVA